MKYTIRWHGERVVCRTVEPDEEILATDLRVWRTHLQWRACPTQGTAGAHVAGYTPDSLKWRSTVFMRPTSKEE